MEWISVDAELPECIHHTSDGNFSDYCVGLSSAHELHILALCEQYDSSEERWNHYWGTYDEIYEEDVYGEIVAWLPIPSFDHIKIKEK